MRRILILVLVLAPLISHGARTRQPSTRSSTSQSKSLPSVVVYCGGAVIGMPTQTPTKIVNQEIQGFSAQVSLVGNLATRIDIKIPNNVSYEVTDRASASKSLQNCETRMTAVSNYFCSNQNSAPFTLLTRIESSGDTTYNQSSKKILSCN